MSKLKELREKQARIVTQARSLLEEIKTDTPEARCAELEAQHDAAMADYDKVDGEIRRLEKLEAAEARLRAGDSRRPVLGEGETRGDEGGDAPTYGEAFQEYLRCAGNQGEMRAEHRAVLKSGFVAAPAEKRAQTAGTNAAGGFTVPTELQAILVKSMKLWGPMYNEDLCTVLTTASGNPLPMPTIDDTAKRGGQQAEGVTLTDDGSEDAVFAQNSLGAFSYSTEWIRCSMELANDSIFNMNQLLGDLLGERLARRGNLELTVGDGTGDPQGIVTGASLGVTAASATAITSDEIIDLIHSVDAAYRKSPKVRFQLHDTTLKSVRKLKDTTGQYLWTPGMQTDAADRIYGYAYSVNNDMATPAAAARTIIFGDHSKYYVRKVGDILIGAIQDKDFWPGFGIAGYLRMDGRLADTAAVKYLRQL